MVMTSEKKSFSIYFYNSVTYLGAFIAIFVFLVECFLFSIDFFSAHHSTYLGLYTYILLPPFLILGLILIPLGAQWKRQRVLAGKSTAAVKTIFINPSLPAHRNAVFVFVLGTTILLFMTAVGSYKAYHYTESVEFCGKVCHKIMGPQDSLYKQSPHARVDCVQCHIGSGANSYVRYKVAGARMLLATVQNNYQRPIPTPVHNLRPASETCEQCHWPGKHYSSFEMRKTYFPITENEDKTWYIRMLVAVGAKEGELAGIHAHMYKDNEIYYVADDDKRQKISWVKSVDKDGKETIYMSEDSLYKEQAPANDKLRKMDCMDCHNRPAHHFKSPNDLMNDAMLRGTVDKTIPGIKQIGMELLSGKYEAQAQALVEIPIKLREYYQKKQTEYYGANKEKIDFAANTLVEIFQSNFFPEMKARWDVYPENIGHWISPGCFRCHDDEHKSIDGKVISRDCKVCHTIIEQGPSGATEKSIDGLDFKHPFDGDETWKDMNCSDCHTGN